MVKNTYNKTVLDDVSNSIVNEIEVVLNEGLDAANKMIEESESSLPQYSLNKMNETNKNYRWRLT